MPAQAPTLAPAAARPLLLAGLLLLLPGCGWLPERADPILFLRDAIGASQDTRLPPPGLDRPTPNLASVPPVPERPDMATRQAILRGLEAARQAAATPLPDGRPDAPVTGRAAPGAPPIAAGPPGPPRLTRAPAVPWAVMPAAVVPAQGERPLPALPPLPLPEPGAVPPPPAPELLAPPAPPPAELLAPAPRGG